MHAMVQALSATLLLRVGHLVQPSSHCVPRAKLVGRAVVPQDIPLNVVYEDSDVLAINKPPGATVQLAQNAVENAVAFHLNSTSCQWSTSSWPWRDDESFEGIVHRLDKGTSGLLVIGKHPKAARALQAAFRERRVDKTYLAIAVGMPTRQSAQRLEAMEASNSRASKSSKVVSRHAQQSADPRHKRLMSAIKGCGRNFDQAGTLLDEAFSAGEHPSSRCYSAALSVCMRGASHVEAPLEAPLEAPAAPRSQRLSSRRAALSVVDGVAARGAALAMLESMHVRDVTPDVSCFQTVLGLCSREPPLWKEAVGLVDQMRVAGLEPSAQLEHCVSCAISACGRAGELEAALALLELELNPLPPDADGDLPDVDGDLPDPDGDLADPDGDLADGDGDLADGGCLAVRGLVKEDAPTRLRGLVKEDAPTRLMRGLVKEDAPTRLSVEGRDGSTTRLRAAIRAAERCGAVETTRVLAGRLELATERTASGGGGACGGGGGASGRASTGADQGLGDQGLVSQGLVAAHEVLGEALMVDSPIGKLGKYTMGLMAVADGGRSAVSVVTPLAFDGARSVNRVVIETGRTHQIRVHLASVLSCPLAGDADYGRVERRAASPLGTQLGPRTPPVARVMLHAAELVMPHPILNGAMLRLQCPPPADFMALATAIFEGSATITAGGTRRAVMSDAAVTAAMMTGQ